MEKTQKMIQSEETRKLILAQSTRLFAKKGYYATSIADISNATGLTKGALYHHFESKEAIFFSVLENIRLTWATTIGSRLNSSQDIVSVFSTLIDGHTVLFEENESFCLALNAMMMEMEGVNSTFQEAMQNIYREFTGFIEEIVTKGQQAGQIRADLEPHLLAFTLVSSLRGAGCSRAMFTRMGVDFGSMMTTLKKLIIQGLRP
jgi:AcrR family transcriptional regulator